MFFRSQEALRISAITLSTDWMSVDKGQFPKLHCISPRVMGKVFFEKLKIASFYPFSWRYSLCFRQDILTKGRKNKA